MDLIKALIAILSCSDLETILNGLTTLRTRSVFNFPRLFPKGDPSRSKLDKADKTMTKSKAFSNFRK